MQLLINCYKVQVSEQWWSKFNSWVIYLYILQLIFLQDICEKETTQLGMKIVDIYKVKSGHICNYEAYSETYFSTTEYNAMKHSQLKIWNLDFM